MTTPVRVQLRPTKGWRMPPNTVSVARPGPFGNSTKVIYDDLWNGGRINACNMQPIYEVGPWVCQLAPGPDTPEGCIAGIWFKTKAEAAGRAVAMFRLRVERLAVGAAIRDCLPELRGKNLACWCPLDQPCHADVLLELANSPATLRRGA
jgi:hypothetical protein